MSTKIVRPQWCKDCRKELIQRDMTLGDLAKELGVSREYVTATLNGRVNFPDFRKKVCDFLGVQYPEEAG